jgi:CDP-glycerol glycerophosphotransferase (TagB/SpsB family)
LNEILPPSPIKRSNSRLKIVMFLRKANFTTFWEEVAEVVHLIAEFPGTEIIIKPHTRSGWKQSLTKEKSIKQLPNVSIADDNAHSAHLMNWADVIIDLATSVIFEAVRTKKPVLAADYLIAGRSTVACYMPETELRCRDDVYEKIHHFLNNGCDDFYVEAHRQRFLQEMLDVPDENVLQHYVTLLEESAEETD